MRPFVRMCTAPNAMITSFKRFAAAVCVALGFGLPAHATSYSTDFSDLWWAGETENGWGINFIQQAEVIFATMFVYGTDNTPRWYVASNLSPSGSGSTTFVGALYRTTGPYFGTAWTGTATPIQVGTMTVAFNSPTNATLNYTVEGTSVTKNITRQTWRINQISGNYLGGITATGSGCSGSSNGPILIFGNMRITQTGNTAVAVRIDFVSNSGVASFCNMNGTMSQSGKLGALSGGTFACTFGSTPGNQGTFSLSAIDVTNNGISASFTGQDQFCSYSGRFGGLRDII